MQLPYTFSSGKSETNHSNALSTRTIVWPAKIKNKTLYLLDLVEFIADCWYGQPTNRMIAYVNLWIFISLVTKTSETKTKGETNEIENRFAGVARGHALKKNLNLIYLAINYSERLFFSLSLQLYITSSVWLADFITSFGGVRVSCLLNENARKYLGNKAVRRFHWLWHWIGFSAFALVCFRMVWRKQRTQCTMIQEVIYNTSVAESGEMPPNTP